MTGLSTGPQQWNQPKLDQFFSNCDQNPVSEGYYCCDETHDQEQSGGKGFIWLICTELQSIGKAKARTQTCPDWEPEGKS